MGKVLVDPQHWEASEEAGVEALLESWVACEGDRVHTGQVLGKARLAGELVDVQAPHDGLLDQIEVRAGERFGPGTVLAHVIDF
jgi:pyruvate dehydrogenase E2 component (dihydrolipoamide acetyltransferase)